MTPSEYKGFKALAHPKKNLRDRGDRTQQDWLNCWDPRGCRSLALREFPGEL
jgi:hypothetical protein